MRTFLVTCVVIVACGSSSVPPDGGFDGGEGGVKPDAGGDAGTMCCPLAGGACAGGGSKRLTNCVKVCDCLKITGTGVDADGCPFDEYVSTYPNCGGMNLDSGTDAPKDAPGEGG